MQRIRNPEHKNKQQPKKARDVVFWRADVLCEQMQSFNGALKVNLTTQKRVSMPLFIFP
jgi:hypothetical protein